MRGKRAKQLRKAAERIAHKRPDLPFKRICRHAKRAYSAGNLKEAM